MNCYVMKCRRGCGFPKSADAAQRYEKLRLSPWTTPNTPNLNCGLPSCNGTLITEVQPNLFVRMCLSVCNQMTFACSGGAAFDAGGGRARHARGGCFMLRLRLWNCAQQSGPLLAAAPSMRNAVSALSARQSPSCRTTSSLPHTFRLFSVCCHDSPVLRLASEMESER